ncbi:hypothetical protein [Candidatus Nitrosocosmicus hydrocola]|uniref:hypothetical protein n=1 Tax=Candidatus Nitrosocosmicus hydrocola TaxID=1826872 RepID=UPI0011E5E834|nr:hypothetical protein [Candidatus Nitrosocosmicus hydrocola]
MNVTRPQLAVVIGLTIVTIILLFYYLNEFFLVQQQREQPPIEPQRITTPGGQDQFSVSEIYPTKEEGREWYINMQNPEEDDVFSISSDVPILRSAVDNEAWLINDTQVRMNVITPQGQEPWRDIEMTGYFKVRSIYDPNSPAQEQDGNGNSNEGTLIPDLTMRARGGSHSSEIPCDGTALNGSIDVLKREAAWKKEIWHTGGYTDAKGSKTAFDSPLLDNWVGLKVVMYNINNDTGVKMESYVDANNTNEWVKVNEVIDEGGWFANSSDEVFNSANCGKSKDYVITNSGPIATFRADNLAFDFKNLSIREINPV